MIQGSEIIIILLVALVVLGPTRLPEIARKIGRWTVELRQAASDLRRGLEAEVGDLREIRRDLEEPIDDVRREFKDVNRRMDDVADETRGLRWVGPEPQSGPKPSDALSDLEKIEDDPEQDASA
ncbi:MAG: twin-arginine translocase TatA/TatE family subunit [Actinomycetota bacterium]